MGNQKGKGFGTGPRSPNARHCQSSGEIALLSGIYRLQHQEHPIQEELLVIKGSTLPFCPACGNAIDFHLVVRVEHIDDDPDFQPLKRE